MTSVDQLIERIDDAASVLVVMDVGAHVGNDSIPVARRYRNLRVFAVEPTPSLAQGLRDLTRDLPNYTVIEAAIDAVETEQTFNLVGKGLAGLNSLNDYAPGVERSVRELPPVTERIRLKTKRLDTICDEHGIDAIDILHVDAQGSDVRILASLGDRLDQLKAGAIEVSNRLKLYVASVHRDEARAFLATRGFVVVDIQPVNRSGAEQNMLFVRRRFARGFVPRHAPYLLYRGLALRCSLNVTLGRAGRFAERVRARAALRTRARQFVSRWSQ
jgi:FkbM family methyltransferase